MPWCEPSVTPIPLRILYELITQCLRQSWCNQCWGERAKSSQSRFSKVLLFQVQRQFFMNSAEGLTNTCVTFVGGLALGVVLAAAPLCGAQSEAQTQSNGP